MSDLRDRLEELFAEMDDLQRRLDWYREHYEQLVDQKERQKNDDAMRGCSCRCHRREPAMPCFGCGHVRDDHRGPRGECWFVDEGACASACGGYEASPVMRDAGES